MKDGLQSIALIAMFFVAATYAWQAGDGFFWLWIGLGIFEVAIWLIAIGQAVERNQKGTA